MGHGPLPFMNERAKKAAVVIRQAKAGRGLLRPKILIYGEGSPDKSKITAAFNSDLAQPIDVVLIIGTRLSIPTLTEFPNGSAKL